MGLRGPQPNVIKIDAPTLEYDNPPDELGEKGREFWSLHFDYLTSNNLLTTATSSMFLLLCEEWDLVHTTEGKERIEHVKLCDKLSKVFRLQPHDKPGQKPTDRYGLKGEF
jgi:hypothetical protein